MGDVESPPANAKSKNACANLPCRFLVVGICGLMIIAGFVAFVFGCLFTWAESTVESYLRQPIEAYMTYANYPTDAAARSTLLNALLEYTEPVGQIAFWIGLFLMMICGVGLYGAIAQSRFCLFVFSAMLLSKILVTSVIIVAFHSNPEPVVGTFKKLVEKSVKGYKSIRSKDPHSLVLNVMMPYLQCCGVNDGEDFAGSKNFDNKFIDGENVYNLHYPYSCCKLKDNYEKLPNKCPSNFDDRNSNIKTGCWPKLQRSILMILTRVSYTVIFATLIEFLLACISIHTTLTMEEDKKTHH